MLNVLTQRRVLAESAGEMALLAFFPAKLFQPPTALPHYRSAAGPKAPGGRPESRRDRDSSRSPRRRASDRRRGARTAEPMPARFRLLRLPHRAKQPTTIEGSVAPVQACVHAP